MSGMSKRQCCSICGSSKQYNQYLPKLKFVVCNKCFIHHKWWSRKGTVLHRKGNRICSRDTTPSLKCDRCLFSQNNLLSGWRLLSWRLQLKTNMQETWHMNRFKSKSLRWSVVVPLLGWLIVQIFEWCLGVVSRLVLVHFRSTIYYSWGVVTRLLCRCSFFIFVALSINWETPLTIIQKLSQELDSMMFSSDWIFWWLGLG